MEPRAGCVLAHNPRVGIADLFDWIRGQAYNLGIPLRHARVMSSDLFADLFNAC